MRSARSLQRLVRPGTPARALHGPARAPSVGLVGAPFSKGQPRSGVEFGPSRIREFGLVDLLRAQGCSVQDFGDLDFEVFPEDPPVFGVKNPLAVGSANQRLSQTLNRIKTHGHTALLLGGDHRWTRTRTRTRTRTETRTRTTTEA
ncbi:arginase-1-like [Boleophthalmus pectinirostris]|uniref:arginase-1-like n=1 Tax=Boleophthalmus pectinirostris TaxID=150288 RepID=UPI00242AAB8B|nr:arginase-1-like [Boleophthalmus pectinirostris]